MNYSIIIPVFNKAALTRQCLQTIRPTLEGAGEGEIIVIDNASSDETPEMLQEFPWVRVVRNEENRGFSGANNQGAALACGEFLVLLNNDIVAHEGWLASMLDIARDPCVGVVGARLLFPDGTLQHAGVRLTPLSFGLPGFVAFHDLYRAPRDYPAACETHDLEVVTGACLVTPRELYLRLGGLDEGFWNGYEDVDYCLKVRERGLRVVYDGSAVLTHFESQSGPQRFRKVPWNVARLAHRWNGRVSYDAQRASMARGLLRRNTRMMGGLDTVDAIPIPKTTIVCIGAAPPHRGLQKMLLDNRSPVERIVYASSADAIGAANAASEVRGNRYLAFVDSRCRLQTGWLDHLIAQSEFSRNCAASTYDPAMIGENVAPFTADARCTLLRLAKIPQHLRFEQFPTLGGSVADLLVRVIGTGSGTHGSAVHLGDIPDLEDDLQFRERHGLALRQAIRGDASLVEAALREHGPRRRDGLISIVMLSWNAPQFTRIALDSIREHTRGHHYEIIIVDNGSGPETVEWLRTLTGVRVIYNGTNRGYAGGNNQALAAARGEYVVLLNNDVIVTEGWLDGLLGAFDRIPALGVSAPRSNKIAGDQITIDANYENIDQMHVYARKRRERFFGEGYLTDRAIGLCLCIDRRVVEQVGGIDERFGVGNFEDDDFCLRVRAAGYNIFVCDDVFIHHFGSQTFAANNVDWTATMRENWRKFAKKWGYPTTYPDAGYPTTPAIAGGYDRAKHYVPLPQPQAEERERAQVRNIELAFTASVSAEADWTQVGAFVRRYMQAFTAEDPILLSIAVSGDLSASDLGQRVEKLLLRLGIDPQRAPDVEIIDEGISHDTIEARHIVEIEAMPARSPSALRRVLQEALR